MILREQFIVLDVCIRKEENLKCNKPKRQLKNSQPRPPPQKKQQNKPKKGRNIIKVKVDINEIGNIYSEVQ